MKDGQPEITIESLKQIDKISSLSAHGQILLARAYEMSGDTDSAQREWVELSGKTALSDEAYLEIYTSLLRLEDLVNALQTLDNWQEVSPSNPQITYYLGINLIFIDQNEARKYLQLAVQNENLNSEEISDLIAILELEGRESGYYWTLIGQSLGNLDEWYLAKAAIERAIKFDPSYADAWCLLGETKGQLGQDGYPELVTAQKLNPNSSYVKATLSLYWRREGHPEVALLYLHDLAQAEPDNSTWQIELAQTYVEMRDMISALSYFHSATNIDPENPGIWQKTAEFCLTYDIDLEGLGAQAIDQAMKLASDDAISLDLMGWKLMKSGDFDNAAKFFRKALSIDYYNGRVHMHLGQALMNMDQRSEAQIELRKAIDFSNDEAIKEMAQRLLEQLESQR